MRKFEKIAAAGVIALTAGAANAAETTQRRALTDAPVVEKQTAPADEYGETVIADAGKSQLEAASYRAAGLRTLDDSQRANFDAGSLKSAQRSLAAPAPQRTYLAAAAVEKVADFSDVQVTQVAQFAQPAPMVRMTALRTLQAPTEPRTNAGFTATQRDLSGF